jgi:hypothetical protein
MNESLRLSAFWFPGIRIEKE